MHSYLVPPLHGDRAMVLTLIKVGRRQWRWRLSEYMSIKRDDDVVGEARSKRRARKAAMERRYELQHSRTEREAEALALKAQSLAWDLDRRAGFPLLKADLGWETT